MGQVTFGVLMICIGIFGVGWLMKEDWLYNLLMFGPREVDLKWQYISEGQVWRVFTPALIHFGFLHVIFNLMC